MTFIDANVILRYVTTPENPNMARMSEASQRLFERVIEGTETITISEAALTEVVYVMRSPRWYAFSPSEISARLKPLIGLPGFQIENKRRYLRALDIFVSYAPHLDMEDALSVAYVENTDPPEIYSFDTDFDRVSTVTRKEP